MNKKRIDALLVYILLEAQKSDDFKERSLGPIHFIKYVYLADLAYAETHNGETFTGIQWQFYYYGPWDVELWKYIEPSLASSGVQATRFPSDYESTDAIRWSGTFDNTLKSIAANLFIELQGVLSKAIRCFSNYTPELLNYVYNTPPMLKAAPQEFLDFLPTGWRFDASQSAIFIKKQEPALKYKEEKKIKAWKEKASATLRAKIAERIEQRRQREVSLAPPIYDNVYFESVALLDAEMGEPLDEGNIKVTVLDDVWKSGVRNDPA